MTTGQATEAHYGHLFLSNIAFISRIEATNLTSKLHFQVLFRFQKFVFELLFLLKSDFELGFRILIRI